jgi:hypothetical protein
VVVTMTAVDPDRIDRVTKLLVDAGDAATFAAAETLLKTYRLQIMADAAACAEPGWQAALMTAVNTGKRAVHGGVRVALGADPVSTVPWARGRKLSAVLGDLGAQLTTAMESGVPTIAVGTPPDAVPGPAPTINPTAGLWIAGISPGPASVSPSPLAGAFAGALAVAEAFQWLRGHAVAGDREFAISLWDPDGGTDGPPITDLPTELWLLGLGHLGQAYAWLLGMLTYPKEGARRLVLQDDDSLTSANRATSMLHRAEHLGLPKTRLVANVMEPLGWETSLIERRYRGGQLRDPQDPAVVLVGVDNPDARRLLDDTGFPLILDAGLGAGPDGYLDMTIRRLPADRPSRELWPENARAPRRPLAPAYDALANGTGDACGVEQLAGRTVATSFVGVAAACWALGGLLRELHGGRAYGLVDHSLRDPAQVTAVDAAQARPARLPTVTCSH